MKNTSGFVSSLREFLAGVCIIGALTFAAATPLFGAGSSPVENLVRSGDFTSLVPWQQNDHLARAGRIATRVGESGVTISNPRIDVDASLWQETPVGGQVWLAWSIRARPGEPMMRASLGLVALDASGNVLGIETPTKIQAREWRTYAGTWRTPTGTTSLRVTLSVLDGSCSFSDVRVQVVGPPDEPVQGTRLPTSGGFSVREFATERPFWEIFCDDLHGDGRVEIVGCDVDGVVTIRNEGCEPIVRFDAGALVYQFAAADLDGDGAKEILFSSVDPKFPLRAADLKGRIVRVFDAVRGPERLAVGDIDGDGRPEIAASTENQIAGSGIAAGVAVYDRTGMMLWSRHRNLRHFAFAEWDRAQRGQELVVGGPEVEFTVYGSTGAELQRVSAQASLLEQFDVVDLGRDGTPDLVALYQSEGRFSLLCHDGRKVCWDTPVPVSLRGTGTGASALLACGDFDRKTPGWETVIVGQHIVSMVDAEGALVYRSRDGAIKGDWEMWAPGGIRSADIASLAGAESLLYLSSSRFRHAAYYRIVHGGSDELGSYRVSDDERHLEELYGAVKASPALSARSPERIKVFIASSDFARVPEATLMEYAAALRNLESPSLEYMVMYEASDMLSHERGQKMTTDQIVERARLFEKAGQPFGYFAAHGGQVWLSREAIRRSKEVAPRMFRFLYVAENLETLYAPLYKDVLRWTDDALDFCAAHGMKMVFKEKHDVWGLLPADKEVFDVLFSPRHRDVTVPIWATNQPYQPEIQLSGMLGLKAAGLCREFGMSTQYWNWHEWGRYPRGIRDSSPTYVCPSDIILRLELMGVALGGTWVHIEGGQVYMPGDPRRGVLPLAHRHRELVYEMVRKNYFVPGALPANLNATSVVRALHPAIEAGKARGKKVAYPYYDRNEEALRHGFIPARYLFETYGSDAFPRVAYDEAWNVLSCFPRTPLGWIPVLPPQAPPRAGARVIDTDGERVRLEGVWRDAAAAAPEVACLLQSGASEHPLTAPGACVIVQADPADPATFVATLIDPGYLAPTGVQTTLAAPGRTIRAVVDLISGAALPVGLDGCAVRIHPGAFRVLRVEL